MPAWPLVELLNGRKFQLAGDVRIIQRFAIDIINKRRKQYEASTKPDTHANGNGSCMNGAFDAEGNPRDLLSLFMESKGPDGKPLTDKQLVDTVLNFIIAGRDTTAQVGCCCIQVKLFVTS